MVEIQQINLIIVLEFVDCIFSSQTAMWFAMHCESPKIRHVVDNWQQQAQALESLGHILFSSQRAAWLVIHCEYLSI